MHDFGVYWYTKDCLRCYCTREVVSCCNITLTPVGYDQEKCESVFDVESCSYQKFLLFLFLILLTLGSLCTAQCYMRPPNKYGCVEKRKLYHFGVVWKTKDCFRCECQPRAMICCSLVFRPTNYDRENCIALFHKKSCSMRVVWKSDPQEPCNVFAGVG
ncbi:beta-microseminoprotein-like isoform X3 [Chelonoidis abingdonii]|nr:beta-microseminoprotein-like isoform X3 [Chelonoidis abingdonii]